MSQALFRDPIVSAGPTRTGTGNGTLVVDKLTHFTTQQNYTATCIGTSPDTVFSITGSQDGPVGIATVGTQFFDVDLKIFLTIQQGVTPFVIGDQFTFSVVNGTDLNQLNIDAYDELAQKNFAAGARGTLAGDDNLRFNGLTYHADRQIGDLYFRAVAAGASGDLISLELVDGTAAVTATKVLQDLTYSAKAVGAAGNNVSIEYLNYIPNTSALLTIQNVKYQAVTSGTGGNSIRVRYTTGATAGSEIVSVSLNDITVQIQSGVSTATQIVSAVNASLAASALVGAVVTPTGTGATTQTAPVSFTNLAGGTNGTGYAGSEVVSVIGNAITVRLQTGVSTATQVKAAVEASSPASALVSVAITGTGSNAQTAPVLASNLTGGTNSVGFAGNEVVTVVGNAITVQMESGVSTAQQIYNKLSASSPTLALVSVTIAGSASQPQVGDTGALLLSSGRSGKFAFNTAELTDSSNFSEGNGSLDVKNLNASRLGTFGGGIKSTGMAFLADSVAANKSGPAVNNVQRFINFLIERGRVEVRTVSNSPIRWVGGILSFTTAIEVKFLDTSVTNTVPVTQAPIVLSDGQSAYLMLNPDETQNIVVGIGSTIPNTLYAFRLCTRSGSKLIWFNGVTMADNDVAQLASGVDYRDQSMVVLCDGGIVTHDSATLGKMTWDADLTVRMIGSSATITITAGNVTLADDQVAYLQLDEPFATGTKTLVVADRNTADLYRADRLWIFERSGLRVYVRNGDSFLRGQAHALGSSSGGGSVKVNYYDPVSTTMPSSSTYVVDGSAIANNDRVLFSALTNPSLNNQVYKATVSGASLTWALQPDFSTGPTPVAGDEVRVISGLAFAKAYGAFDGTTFKFNEYVRYYNGTDYWEASSLYTASLSNNTTGTLFSMAYAGSENIIVDFSILRGSAKETGTLHITTDGTSVAVSQSGASLTTTGVEFSGAIAGSTMTISYTADNSGSAGTMKYMIRRWSNTAGGPAGPPSYSSGGSSPTTAAGSSGQIQYNGSGLLAADSDFTWDATNNILGLAGLEVKGLSAPVTLTDNSSAVTWLTYDAATYRFVIVEFSIVRDGKYRMGRMLVTNDGTNIAFSDDSVMTGDPGVTLSAVVSGSNILLKYSTTLLGVSGTLKYSLRRWT